MSEPESEVVKEAKERWEKTERICKRQSVLLAEMLVCNKEIREAESFSEKRLDLYKKKVLVLEEMVRNLVEQGGISHEISCKNGRERDQLQSELEEERAAKRQRASSEA